MLKFFLKYIGPFFLPPIKNLKRLYIFILFFANIFLFFYFLQIFFILLYKKNFI
ncbi:hypothetical protein HMPREF0202_01314 [Cetobacterium somerae ATCC BAA-474]|uniref:Uncharacterized protein n=1 Tax=Cetobacterium somerae ATCC BAA-474 TaxID=1319815 RepID=U7VAQ8_9FUSO|nr:hypothetical protein HMPREF0202_01314 [Cetobacterium somerae ATCC BAA-474]